MAGLALTLVINSNKAVAVGAISFYLDHFVAGRISKFTYGVPCSTIYRSFNPEHTKRKHKAYFDATGDKLLPDCFNTMLSRVRQPSSLSALVGNFVVPQGTKVLEDREVRSSFCHVSEGNPGQQAFQPVIKYTGARSAPEWMDIELGIVFSLNDLVRDTQVEQESLRRCALYKQTSPLLPTRHNGGKEGG